MWPFGKRLRDQDGVEKYRRWMRRWLVEGRGRYAAAASIAVVLLAGLAFAAVSVVNKPASTAENGPASEVSGPQHPAAPNWSTGKPVDQLPLENTGENGDGNAAPEQQAQAAAAGVGEGNPDLALPVQGTQISAYGFHYSDHYEDYRFHKGVTYRAGEGSQVRPCLPGKVAAVSGENKYTVRVEHENGLASTYAGLASVAVSGGDVVTSSDVLGRAGEEVKFTLLEDGKAVDPANYF